MDSTLHADMKMALLNFDQKAGHDDLLKKIFDSSPELAMHYTSVRDSILDLVISRAIRVEREDFDMAVLSTAAHYKRIMGLILMELMFSGM